MPLDPRDFPTRSARAALDERAEKHRVRDHEKAVAYLTGKGEPNVFTVSRARLQVPEVRVHLALEGEKQTLCGAATESRSVQYVRGLQDGVCVDCSLCVEAYNRRVAAGDPKVRR